MFSTLCALQSLLSQPFTNLIQPGSLSYLTYQHTHLRHKFGPSRNYKIVMNPATGLIRLLSDFIGFFARISTNVKLILEIWRPGFPGFHPYDCVEDWETLARFAILVCLYLSVWYGIRVFCRSVSYAITSSFVRLWCSRCEKHTRRARRLGRRDVLECLSQIEDPK